jgi:hypothetical protein
MPNALSAYFRGAAAAPAEPTEEKKKTNEEQIAEWLARKASAYPPQIEPSRTKAWQDYDRARFERFFAQKDDVERPGKVAKAAGSTLLAGLRARVR